MKRIPLRLEGGEVIGTAEVDEATGEIEARVTDPVAAAKLNAALGPSGIGSFSIAGHNEDNTERHTLSGRPEPRVVDRPSHEEARRNQLRGTCGGTRWRYVGGDSLGWWDVCKGCPGCEP